MPHRYRAAAIAARCATSYNAAIVFYFWGVGMAAGDGKDKKPDNFWLYVWLGISGLLNISGMASIVDGFVTWAKFFREFIDAYRWAIRDPLAHLGNAIWPFGHIPGWVFDVFVLWSALFLALNIFVYREEGKLIFGVVRDEVGDFGQALVSALAFSIFLPLTLCVFRLGLLAGDDEERGWYRDMALGIAKNFVLILGLFILILLVNWQLKKLG
jgi:hypothetical protein